MFGMLPAMRASKLDPVERCDTSSAMTGAQREGLLLRARDVRSNSSFLRSRSPALPSASPRSRPPRPRPDPRAEAQELLHAARRHDRRDVPHRRRVDRRRAWAGTWRTTSPAGCSARTRSRCAGIRGSATTRRATSGWSGSAGRASTPPTSRSCVACCPPARAGRSRVSDSPWRPRRTRGRGVVEIHAVDGDYFTIKKYDLRVGSDDRAAGVRARLARRRHRRRGRRSTSFRT